MAERRFAQFGEDAVQVTNGGKFDADQAFFRTQRNLDAGVEAIPESFCNLIEVAAAGSGDRLGLLRRGGFPRECFCCTDREILVHNLVSETLHCVGIPNCQNGAGVTGAQHTRSHTLLNQRWQAE